MNCLLAIIGPTATGKSRLAIELASIFNGEIINADSRQVYRYMNIGTSKPEPNDFAAVKHHLFDIVDPNEDFNLATYKQMAVKTIEEIQFAGRIPILTGGSGLYIWSILEGWQIPEVPPVYELRKTLENRANKEGTNTLYEELKSIDPVAAGKILPGNIRRIIRALEIYYTTGISPSKLQTKQPPKYPVLILGLTANRTSLYHMIDSRVDRMLEIGLVDEVKRLINMGYGLHLQSMNSIGYKEIGTYLAGKLDYSSAVDQIKYGTHQLARRQYTWFRQSDERIKWMDIAQWPLEDASTKVKLFLERLQ